jgi:cytochrome b pre-mRNA-processing protein 3
MRLKLWLSRGSDASLLVYQRIVAQARHPRFYAAAGVPDTTTGRFEMLALHLFLVLHRLKRERGDPDCAALAQALADHVVADLDANLREMGAGDLGVGRRVKRMSAALYGRIAAFDAGLDGGESALREAVRRTVFATVAPAEGQVEAMARYLVAGRDLLAGRSAAELAAGAVEFPAPR